MSREPLYVIEARDENGQLLLGQYPQPESIFGRGAIHGMTTNQMAEKIFHYHPDSILDGRFIPLWPTAFYPRWIARRKTW